MYARKAREVLAAVEAAIPTIRAAGIGEKGRSKSFEIFLTVDKGGEEKLLWSGRKLGPPRRLKFPEVDHIVSKVTCEVDGKPSATS